MNSPIRHLSIRVPWHDLSWNGSVCQKPSQNSACLCLKNIAEKKDETSEDKMAGQSFQNLNPSQLPPCLMERGAFMSDFPVTSLRSHPYSKTSPDTHAHYRPTPLHFPPFSAPALPFRWMQKEVVWGNEDEKNSISGLIESYPLSEALIENEPTLNFNTSWVQDARNHRELLDCFWNHIKPQESLVFFYSRDTPLNEAPGQRIIVGVGRVTSLGPLTEYEYAEDAPDDALRSLLWERMVTHSIRPDFSDGFLMPYHQAVEKQKTDDQFDPSPLIAYAPEDRTHEYSYVTEHVTPDGALSSLLVVAEALQHAAKTLEGDFTQQLQWIDEQISRLWKQRGSCPGLGSVLTAMGLPLASFIANEVVEQTKDYHDPWPVFEEILADPNERLPKELANKLSPKTLKRWLRRSDSRKSYIRLLSRFDLTPEQARAFYDESIRESHNISKTNQDFIENPYLFFETSLFLPRELSISLSTIDRGLFPASPTPETHPIPQPSAPDNGSDVRRLKALTIQSLEAAAADGHTLQMRDTILNTIRELPLSPKCEVSIDVMEDAENEVFGDDIDFSFLPKGIVYYQLTRLKDCKDFISKKIKKRKNASDLSIEANWTELLNKDLGELDELRKNDSLARKEKAAALDILANKRISVLIGSAGTGKTTLLKTLIKQPDIASGGVLLLAPTGKARVQMERLQSQNQNLQAKTIAQFLYKTNRFNPLQQGYQMTGQIGDRVAKTIIIDECSMLTEEMLAATLEALEGVERLILIGDPRQLPPIGAGRPFVDLVEFLKPETFTQGEPKVNRESGYAELQISMRQHGERDDVKFAKWFTDDGGDEDDFTSILTGNRKNAHLEVRSWHSVTELQDVLREAMDESLGENGKLTQARFDELLGAEQSKDTVFFNRDKAGAHAEKWQILTPVRQHSWGVTDLNREIHQRFRNEMMQKARRPYRSIPKPVGADLIVYGDKVINNKNSFRWSFPAKEMRALANGEIGIVIGKCKRGNPKELFVEFSSQTGQQFTFKSNDFSTESEDLLELAYALTIHRAQGSQFEVVFLVLPKNRRMLNREMLYTALTRQEEKVVLLCEGSPLDLLTLSNAGYSATKSRLTNLFKVPQPILHENHYLDANLIHQTSRGEFVRSKSEVIVADQLNNHNIRYRYEEQLFLGNEIRIPDFTFEDDDTGRTYYWEHCGMRFNQEYEKRWQEKLMLYRSHDILPLDEGGGKKGTLIITNDDSQGGISSKAIGEIIDQLI